MYTTLQDNQTKITEATMEKICFPLSEKRRIREKQKRNDEKKKQRSREGKQPPEDTAAASW
jgi:hypothetical protein